MLSKACFPLCLPTQAYGLRSSDIAENPKLNPNGNANHGPFAGYIGADGTSIWAAATSGPGALEVHLLACILARVWSSAEATSIWDELVSVRKQVLTQRLNDERFYFTTPMTSRIDITRERLADWDASARSVSQHFFTHSIDAYFLDYYCLASSVLTLYILIVVKNSRQSHAKAANTADAHNREYWAFGYFSTKSLR